jgi:hypothetical protein
MAEDRTLRAIAWQQVFPSLRLLAALRAALNFKSLVLAAIAAAGMVAGWRVLGALFADPDNPALAGQIGHLHTWPWERLLFHEPVERLAAPEVWVSQSPLVMAWSEMTAPFRQMYTPGEAPSLANFAYLLCCGLWSLVVWAFFGAAITRQAAVALARYENVSLGQLAAFVAPRWTEYVKAPLFPILGTLLMAAFMALLGLLLRLDFGVLVASIVWPLVLLGGLMMAFLLIGLFFGFPLMWGAISAEGVDSFGALSHSYSYVYQRPLHYLVYAAIAAVVGVLGWYLVSLFVFWIEALTAWGVSWGSGTDRLLAVMGPESMGTLADSGAAVIGFWFNCLYALAYGFVFSYFWSATTAIYFLLRRQVDGTELDEAYMPEEQRQHGLPPLKRGPDGVPSVAEDDVVAGG